MLLNLKAGGTKAAVFTGMFGLLKPTSSMLARFGTYVTTPSISDAEASVSIKNIEKRI
jgi:hypothetical protein